ncbi:MAG: hypothetical protein DMG68_02240 [Acidobacteria bacterium]|jgi:hypothetical protein|nr:MAG: hypothetical protein DMG68_02240 [Acidobacteriota bacterium]
MRFFGTENKQRTSSHPAKDDVLELARLFEHVQGDPKDTVAMKRFLGAAADVLPNVFNDYLLMRDRLCPYCLAGYPFLDGYHDLSGFVQDSDVPIVSRWKEDKRRCVVETLYAREHA